MACVRVIQALPEIQCSAAYQFPIVAMMLNVQLERFVKRAFVVPFVHRIVNVLPINCACKVCANQHAMTIQRVPTSNSVKITFVRRRFDAVAMMIACSTNIVSLTRMVDRNVKMHVKAGICVAVMLNVQPVIIMHCVHVILVSLKIAKEFADQLNVKTIPTVHPINIATRISVNWRAKVVEHAARKLFVPLKIIGQLAIANRAIVAIHAYNVMPSIFAGMLHVDRALCVRITKEHSIVLVVLALLVMLIMKAAAWHSNVNSTLIARLVQFVCNRTKNPNVGMYANESLVDKTPNVCRLIMKLSVNVCRAIVVKQAI